MRGLTRPEALARAGVSDQELARLEALRLVVPQRSWRDLWLRLRYSRDQIRVIRWLVDSHRAEQALREREHKIAP